MLRKKCLGCGAAYTLSGSGRRQRHCETCRHTGRRITGFQPIENKGAKDAVSMPIPLRILGSLLWLNIQKEIPSPITFTLPDGRKGRVWLGARGM